MTTYTLNADIAHLEYEALTMLQGEAIHIGADHGGRIGLGRVRPNSEVMLKLQEIIYTL